MKYLVAFVIAVLFASGAMFLPAPDMNWLWVGVAAALFALAATRLGELWTAAMIVIGVVGILAQLFAPQLAVHGLVWVVCWGAVFGGIAAAVASRLVVGRYRPA